jgi:ligand-binding sensor domain-containing protein
VWGATAGGVARFDRDPVRGGWEERSYGTDAGLDTLDVLRVRCDGARVVAQTATGLCQHRRDDFRCRPHAPEPGAEPEAAQVSGEPVTARASVEGGDLIGTAKHGVYWQPSAHSVEPILPRSTPPTSFLRAAASFGGRIWLGTFNDGCFTIDVSQDALTKLPERLSDAHPVATPFRFVNDVLAAGGALYIAANEGLFATNDGVQFRPVPQVRARGATGLALSGTSLYVTTTSALWRVRLGKSGPPTAAWWRPAGGRSLQGVTVSADGIWLASEDRGAIRFDGKRFVAHDRLDGLPTSWMVAVAGDGRGGVYAATLRDGLLHVDPAGSWRSLEGLPSRWTLSVTRAEGRVCVGTQGGAACYADGGDGALAESPQPLVGLPDARVHALIAVKGGLVAGTQAGIALYPLADI